MPQLKELNIRFFHNGLEIDDRTEDYIKKRLEKIEKFAKNILEYEVEIKADKKGYYRVEIMVKTPYNLYRSEETSESIEGSTDIAIDELKNQIVKDKDKMRDLRERGGRSLKKKAVIDAGARF